MIPLYIYPDAENRDGLLPKKNPVYFFRKAMGKQPTGKASVAILNTNDDSVADGQMTVLGDLLPASFDYRPTHPTDAWYEVEVVGVQPMWDENVEPNADRDGSLASEPRRVQSLITIRGFVRARNTRALADAAHFLNYSFDPVTNFLEGSSTFDHTLAPNSQPFNNVGFGILAWHSGIPSVASYTAHHEILDRFMYARSIRMPIQLATKFDDFQIPFEIVLLAIDPREYELLSPTAFNQSTSVYSSSNGENLTAEIGAPSAVSNEIIVRPTRLWDPFGPGYREQTVALSSGAGNIILDNTDASYQSYPLVYLELTANMGAFGAEEPDIYRQESPNFARHVKLASPIVLDPAPTALNPVKVYIDMVNRQMFVEPAAWGGTHSQEGQIIHYLSQDSRFFTLLPRKINWIEFTNFPDDITVGIEWRQAFV